MSNTLNRLGSVLSGTQRSIVKVLTVNNDGTTTVEHSDGTTSRVLGDSVQEGSVYIENDRITGQAPDLPYSEVVI
ncbi:hypothetical protein [Pseudoalteromonas piscicida]|jgi:hypothetical protein|uniref:Uncharacterized protein n=1 Tax=Pseudoalteromonas piscicida TaxID=43662 RepID=A0AAD0RHZ8_PSEO7|nr:hypothetical protein [Pseudoalteromonas piscicida]ASD67726.1 hypothetical protein B1L02_12315 [Pseudoalteromonas piscicida]AXR01571.1 hypothetical protein D0511_05415 [Pseudoalteromonas piscicida]